MCRSSAATRGKDPARPLVWLLEPGIPVRSPEIVDLQRLKRDQETHAEIICVIPSDYRGFLECNLRASETMLENTLTPFRLALVSSLCRYTHKRVVFSARDLLSGRVNIQKFASRAPRHKLKHSSHLRLLTFRNGRFGNQVVNTKGPSVAKQLRRQ